MKLLPAIIELISPSVKIFGQRRMLLLAIRLSLASLCKTNRGTISQTISFSGREHLDWGSDYKFFSRAKWEISGLFQPIIEETVNYFPDKYIAVAIDETKIKKTGKKIPTTQYHRDPLSPKFHTNLMYGLRILQASTLLPSKRQTPSLEINELENHTSSRGIPIRFKNIPVIAKPSKDSNSEDLKIYKEKSKGNSLSNHGVRMMKNIRKSYDLAGANKKELIFVLDGAFCNKITFGAETDRWTVLTRSRKDAALCFKAENDSRKFYGENKFTPNKVRTDESYKTFQTQCLIDGKYRDIRYKEVKEVYWQRGAKRKTLRLIVILPVPYRKSKNAKRNYREPAYLLTDNLEASTDYLIQTYIDRWQIEVNNRDEKTILRVGEAQVRNLQSVIRQPAFVVASYSMMMLATLKCFGEQRNGVYFPLPKWRKKSSRPSCNDMIGLLQKEIIRNKDYVKQFGIYINTENIITKSIS